MQEMLALAGVLAALTFNLGIALQTLPIPFRSVKMLGPVLMRDSVFTLVAIASVSLVQFATSWLSGVIQTGLETTGTDASAIISQLVLLDGLMFGLIAILNSTVILAPLAGAVANMLSPVLQTVTTALILWIILQEIIERLPSLWLYFYVIGIVLVSVPLRFTHSIGTTAMAGSVVFAVMLPLAPSFALSIQSDMFGSATDQIQKIRNDIESNPLKAFDIPALTSDIANATASMAASVAIALIAFPFAWLFVISIISKSLAELIGGSSVFDASSFIIRPSKVVSK